MPMHFKVDLELGIVVTSVEGDVSDEDVIRHAQALLADPAVHGLNELLDVSGREEISVSTGTVKAAARLLRERGENRPGGRLAILADSDPVFGMARLYQAHRDHPHGEIGVFRDRRKALDWLGVSED